MRKRLSPAVRARTLKLVRMAAQNYMRKHIIFNMPTSTREGVRVINLATGTEVPITSKEASGLSSEPIKWTFHGYFIGRDNNGRNYIQSMEAINFEPVKYEEIRETVGSGITKALKTLCNPNHYITGCWIATSEGKEIDEEYAYDLIKRYGGFDEEAKWELS